MTMITLKTPFRPGIGRGLALGLACCSALAACVGSGDSSSGTGGSTAAASGGATVQTSSGGATFQTSSGGATIQASSGGATVDTSSGGATVSVGSGGTVASSGGLTGSSGGAVGSSGGALAASGGGPAGGSTGSMGGSGSGACAGVFCDGFEGSTKLGAAWTVESAVAANVVEVVSTMAHTGTNSVHMKFTTASGATFIHETMGFPIATALWGRVWMYVMNDPSSNGHDVYIEGSTGMNLTNNGVRPLNTQGGNMSINVDPGLNGGEDGASSNKPIPRGAWTCFEWQITSAGAVTLYMGGTQLATIAKTKVPALIEMRVGYEHYAADKAAGDMWIDDYAVGTSRLNCM
jgi:hypothetical protein